MNLKLKRSIQTLLNKIFHKDVIRGNVGISSDYILTVFNLIKDMVPSSKLMIYEADSEICGAFRDKGYMAVNVNVDSHVCRSNRFKGYSAFLVIPKPKYVLTCDTLNHYLTYVSKTGVLGMVVNSETNFKLPKCVKKGNIDVYPSGPYNILIIRR